MPKFFKNRDIFTAKPVKLGLPFCLLKTFSNFRNVASDFVRNRTDDGWGKTNAPESCQILGRKVIRPKAATPGGKTLEGSTVAFRQTKKAFNREVILATMKTVAIATVQNHITVNRNQVFRFFIFVTRFFYSGDTPCLRQWFRHFRRNVAVVLERFLGETFVLG